MFSIQVLTQRHSSSPRPCARYQNGNSQALEHIYIKLISKLVEALCTLCFTIIVQTYILVALVHENGGYWYVLADKGVFWRASAGFDGQWRIWAESTQ